MPTGLIDSIPDETINHLLTYSPTRLHQDLEVALPDIIRLSLISGLIFIA